MAAPGTFAAPSNPYKSVADPTWANGLTSTILALQRQHQLSSGGVPPAPVFNYGNGSSRSLSFAPYGGMALHRAIVGDPQADGLPNPELVESAGPIRVTPLKNMSGHQALLALARLPRYADGSPDDDDNDTSDANDDPSSNSVPPPAPVQGSINDHDSFAPPPLPSPDFHTDPNSYLQPSAATGQQSTVTSQQTPSSAASPDSGSMVDPRAFAKDWRTSGINSDDDLDAPKAPARSTLPVLGTPSPTPDSITRPIAPDQQPTVNGTSGTKPVPLNPEPKTRNSPLPLTPAISASTLDDVLASNQKNGATPEQTAQAVKDWRTRSLDDHGAQTLSPPDSLAKARQLDKATQNALDTLRQHSDNPDDEENPTFSIPRQPNVSLPINGRNGQELARFQPRFRDDGWLELYTTVPDQDGNGFHYGKLNVPAVTRDDIVNAAKQAALDHVKYSSQADKLQDDAKRAFSGSNDASGFAGVGLQQQATATRQKAQDAAVRSAQLSDPRNAYALLTSERAAEALRKSPLADQVGQGGFTALAQNFYEPIVGMEYKGAAAILDAFGDKAGRDRALQHFEDYKATNPGATRGTFQEGWSAVPGQAMGLAGSIAPVVLSGPYAPITLGMQTAGEADTRALGVAADLRNKAQLLHSSGDHATAQQLEQQAADVERNRALYTIGSTALAVGGGAAIPKLAAGADALTAAGRGTMDMTAIAGLQGQGLDPAFLGEDQRMSAGQTIGQGLLGAALGASSKFFKPGTETPTGKTPSPATQDFPAPPTSRDPITADAGVPPPAPRNAFPVDAELPPEPSVGTPPPAPLSAAPSHPLSLPEPDLPPPAPIRPPTTANEQTSSADDLRQSNKEPFTTSDSHPDAGKDTSDRTSPSTGTDATPIDDSASALNFGNHPDLSNSPVPKSPGVDSDSVEDALNLLGQSPLGEPLARGTLFVKDAEALLNHPEYRNRSFRSQDLEALPQAEGFFDPKTGRTVVMTDQVGLREGETPTEAVARVLLHERVGHEGLNLMRGDSEFAEAWEGIKQTIPPEELEAVGKENPQLGGDHDALAEEWLARQAEKLQPGELPQRGSALDRAWQAVKEYLSNLWEKSGFSKGENFQDDLNTHTRELFARILEGHQQAAENGRFLGGGEDGLLFSRNKGAGKTNPLLAGELTTYKDAVDRRVVGSGLQAHEILQHANLNGRGLVTRRLSTDASKDNPVIMMDKKTHMIISAAQRGLDARHMPTVDNVQVNVDLLRQSKKKYPDLFEYLTRATINAGEKASQRHASKLKDNK